MSATPSGRSRSTSAPVAPSHSFRNTSGAVASSVVSSSTAGRPGHKCASIVLEALYKLCEAVLQARIAFGDQDTGARPKFNFALRELGDLRNHMRDWQRNVHVPLTIEILWRDPRGPQDAKPTLLERWLMHYDAGRRAPADTDATDSEMLRQVYKEFAVLLRAVYSLVRVLPAQSLVRRPSNGLGFQVLASHPRTMPSPISHSFGDVGCDEHDFSPIATPFGKFYLGVKFREDLNFAIVEEPKRRTSILDHVIPDHFAVPKDGDTRAGKGGGGDASAGAGAGAGGDAGAGAGGGTDASHAAAPMGRIPTHGYAQSHGGGSDVVSPHSRGSDSRSGSTGWSHSSRSASRPIAINRGAPRASAHAHSLGHPHGHSSPTYARMSWGDDAVGSGESVGSGTRSNPSPDPGRNPGRSRSLSAATPPMHIRGAHRGAHSSGWGGGVRPRAGAGPVDVGGGLRGSPTMPVADGWGSHGRYSKSHDHPSRLAERVAADKQALAAAYHPPAAAPILESNPHSLPSPTQHVLSSSPSPFPSSSPATGVAGSVRGAMTPGGLAGSSLGQTPPPRHPLMPTRRRRRHSMDAGAGMPVPSTSAPAEGWNISQGLHIRDADEPAHLQRWHRPGGTRGWPNDGSPGVAAGSGVQSGWSAVTTPSPGDARSQRTPGSHHRSKSAAADSPNLLGSAALSPAVLASGGSLRDTPPFAASPFMSPSMPSFTLGVSAEAAAAAGAEAKATVAEPQTMVAGQGVAASGQARSGGVRPSDSAEASPPGLFNRLPPVPMCHADLSIRGTSEAYEPEAETHSPGSSPRMVAGRSRTTGGGVAAGGLHAVFGGPAPGGVLEGISPTFNGMPSQPAPPGAPGTGGSRGTPAADRHFAPVAPAAAAGTEVLPPPPPKSVGVAGVVVGGRPPRRARVWSTIPTVIEEVDADSASQSSAVSSPQIAGGGASPTTLERLYLALMPGSADELLHGPRSAPVAGASLLSGTAVAAPADSELAPTSQADGDTDRDMGMSPPFGVLAGSGSLPRASTGSGSPAPSPAPDTATARGTGDLWIDEDLAFVLDDAPSATFGASPTSPSARGGSPTLDELAGFVRKCHESRPLLITDRGAAGSEAWFSSVGSLRQRLSQLQGALRRSAAQGTAPELDLASGPPRSGKRKTNGSAPRPLVDRRQQASTGGADPDPLGPPSIGRLQSV